MPHNLLFKLELSNLIVESNFSEHWPQLRLPADSFQPSRSGRSERHPRQSRSRKSGQSTSHGLEFHHGCEHRPLGSPTKSLRPAQAYSHLEGKLLYLCDWRWTCVRLRCIEIISMLLCRYRQPDCFCILNTKFILRLMLFNFSFILDSTRFASGPC